MQVQGRSDLFLRLEVIKKAIGVSILCLTIPLGLKAMCFGGVVSSLLCLVINTFYTGKLIQVGFIMQMRDLFPTLVVSLLMFVLVLSLQWMTENLYAQRYHFGQWVLSGCNKDSPLSGTTGTVLIVLKKIN